MSHPTLDVQSSDLTQAELFAHRALPHALNLTRPGQRGVRSGHVQTDDIAYGILGQQHLVDVDHHRHLNMIAGISTALKQLDVLLDQYDGRYGAITAAWVDRAKSCLLQCARTLIRDLQQPDGSTSTIHTAFQHQFLRAMTGQRPRPASVRVRVSAPRRRSPRRPHQQAARSSARSGSSGDDDGEPERRPPAGCSAARSTSATSGLGGDR